MKRKMQKSPRGVHIFLSHFSIHDRETLLHGFGLFADTLTFLRRGTTTVGGGEFEGGRNGGGGTGGTVGGAVFEFAFTCLEELC